MYKNYGDLQVLKGINNHVSKGEVLTVIGPSGSGKSTFLRCLNLLEVPDSGQIYFDGKEITKKGVEVDKHRQKMGMVFQLFNVFPHMTVQENITLAPVTLKKMSQKEANEKAIELLAKIGLLEKKDEYPNRLSGVGSSNNITSGSIAKAKTCYSSCFSNGSRGYVI